MPCSKTPEWGQKDWHVVVAILIKRVRLLMNHDRLLIFLKRSAT